MASKIRNTNMASKIRSANYSNPPRKVDSAIPGYYIVAGVKIAIGIIIFFVIAISFINLNDRTGKIVEETSRLEKEIKITEREIENLRMKNAKLKKLPHIQSKIAEFGLKLRSPDPGQVRQIVIMTPPSDDRNVSSVAIVRNNR